MHALLKAMQTVVPFNDSDMPSFHVLLQSSDGILRYTRVIVAEDDDDNSDAALVTSVGVVVGLQTSLLTLSRYYDMTTNGALVFRLFIDTSKLHELLGESSARAHSDILTTNPSIIQEVFGALEAKPVLVHVQYIIHGSASLKTYIADGATHTLDDVLRVANDVMPPDSAEIHLEMAIKKAGGDERDGGRSWRYSPVVIVDADMPATLQVTPLAIAISASTKLWSLTLVRGLTIAGALLFQVSEFMNYESLQHASHAA
jgi:hypothetical protein